MGRRDLHGASSDTCGAVRVYLLPRTRALCWFGDKVSRSTCSTYSRTGRLTLATSGSCSRRDRPVRSGIGANLRAVHRGIDTFQQSDIHTLLYDLLEEFEDERRLVKTAVSIPDNIELCGDFLIKAQTGEPTSRTSDIDRGSALTYYADRQSKHNTVPILR